jgi:hypothetical protein
MSNVVRMPKLVAWAPTTDEIGVRLSAVLVQPDQRLDRSRYLFLLGERIQCLVNACPDPQDITDALIDDLFEAGLYPDTGHVAAEDAGAYLVSTNPGTRERLDSWGVLPTWEAGPTHEMPAAREALMGERYDVEDHLRSWVGLLSSLP